MPRIASFLAASAAILLIACETTPVQTPRQRAAIEQGAARDRANAAATAEANRVRPFNVEITSDPPGAMIEVEDDARCRAPCVIVVEGQEDRTIPRIRPYSLTKIHAIPTEEGGAVQSKWLSPGQKIPERIFFNMRLMRPTPEIDINVNENL